MIQRLIALSIRHRGVVIGFMLLLAAAGIWATLDTPVDAIPDLSETQVIVFADWQGHTPREIEQQVTYPLAVQLQGVADVRVVRSSSDVNFSMIHVIFDDRVDILTARGSV